MNITTCALVSLALCGAAAAATPSPASAPSDVLAHVERVISWYRDVNAMEGSPELAKDVLLRETARTMSTEALQLAFAFARAEAALSNANVSPGASSEAGSRQGTTGRIEQVAARAATRVANVQVRLENLDAAIANAPERSRFVLLERRQRILAELGLAKQIQESVQNLAAFMGSVGTGNGGLASRIDQLERSVPEAMQRREQRPPQARPAGVNLAAETAPVFRPESVGVAGLATELFTLARARTRMKRVIAETDALLESIGQLRAPLANELRNSVRRADAIGAASESDGSQELAASPAEIQDLATRFKQVSAALIPLREEGILVETSRGNLLEWRTAVDRRYSAVAGYLLVRAAVLGVAIGAMLILSELLRRMIFRYARDARRRRQFLVLRRIVLSCAVALVLVLGFISEVGSLATYAGFLTAGLALALQNPIMSVVAYFFLIGRYGLRVGDRVTISGVTGDVIEIGLVRMHVMELAGQGADLHPTGRVVAFSNAVLFQPAALFKQMPGTDYVWHVVTLSLTPGCDADVAERTLMAAVDSVYEEYRPTIEQQHALFERSLDVKLSPPRPQCRMRFNDAGLEFSIHYPAELRRGPAVDERVMRALRQAIASEPTLSLARAGEPKLQEAAQVVGGG